MQTQGRIPLLSQHTSPRVFVSVWGGTLTHRLPYTLSESAGAFPRGARCQTPSQSARTGPLTGLVACGCTRALNPTAVTGLEAAAQALGMLLEGARADQLLAQLSIPKIWSVQCNFDSL